MMSDAAVEAPLAKTQVLFVDDEVNLLNGLRRMLRHMRADWEMTFVDGGAKALEHMAAAPVDVIVSDMRMPEMDGAELLARVKEDHPGAIRIVLSGYAKNESVIRTVGPSHQYLAKPCDPEVLVRSIKRSLKLRNILESDPLREFVTGLDSLPTPAAAFQAFLDEVNDPTATTDRIAAAVEKDIGLTADVLKLCNSAYFALPTEVKDCRQAVQLLGLDTMRALVLAAGIFRPLKDGSADQQARLELLCQRSLSISALARAVAKHEGFNEQGVSYAASAGLLAHVGTLILLEHSPGEYKFAGQVADEEGTPVVETEKKLFGASHAELGAYLLGLWGFPHPIVEAVAAHHEPGLFDETAFGLSTAVHVAQALARGLGGEDELEALERVTLSVDFKHLVRLKKQDAIDGWWGLADALRAAGDVT